MTFIQIASRHAVAVVAFVLTSAVVIGLIRADEPDGRTVPSQPADNAPDPEATRQEEGRIKQFILQRPDIRQLGAMEHDTTVKHLAGRYYVARVVYAKGHAWRLYLASPLPGNPKAYATSQIGIAAGERGLKLCMSVLLQEHGWPESKIDFRRIVEQSIQALSADYGVVVNRNADIPGYDKAPLASDLAAVIRPIWTYASKGARGEQVTHYVVYTYQQIVGQVFRHEFKFGERAKSATTVRMATGVGDAHYLE